MKAIDKIKILYRLGLDARYPKIFSFHDCLPDIFSQYLELLIAKRYRILDSSQLLERLGQKARFKKEVVLTFDDGRRNCWTVIFPLLKKYKIKASVFIIPSRVKETNEYYPNLEDYWNNKVSWENLYISHRRQPYLTWKELEIMQASGFVDVFSHSLRHQIVAVSAQVKDFQHPGVYEMPVYFDEWFEAGSPELDGLWGAPIYERRWAPLVANRYVPDVKADVVMNEFVRKNGGFLFFKKMKWRQKLFEYFYANKNSWGNGHFKKLEDKEEDRFSIFESKKIIETRLKNPCAFFSLPLYQSSPELLAMIAEAGYKGVLTGSEESAQVSSKILVLKRIPSFWIKFLAYL